MNNTQRPKHNPPWELSEALLLISALEPKLASIGFHCGITGSVLYGGGTGKDLDVLIYPHHTELLWTDKLLTLLKQLFVFGWECSQGGTNGYERDNKCVHVFFTKKENRRIDFFFLGCGVEVWAPKPEPHPDDSDDGLDGLLAESFLR